MSHSALRSWIEGGDSRTQVGSLCMPCSSKRQAANLSEHELELWGREVIWTIRVASWLPTSSLDSGKKRCKRFALSSCMRQQMESYFTQG